jgi:phage gpG-like protein
MPGITLRKTRDEVTGHLKGQEQRLRNLRPVMRVVGEIVTTSIRKNFAVGGRPKRWKPSARARREGGQTLVDTARLKNSIHPGRITARSVRVGTDVVYAAAHHFGFTGTVRIPAHRRVITQAFGKRLATPRVVQVRAHTARRTIPAREFMLLQPEDETEIQATVLDYVQGR